MQKYNKNFVYQNKSIIFAEYKLHYLQKEEL